jgi:hypothetical protein
LKPINITTHIPPTPIATSENLCFSNKVYKKKRVYLSHETRVKYHKPNPIDYQIELTKDTVNAEKKINARTFAKNSLAFNQIPGNYRGI